MGPEGGGEGVVLLYIIMRLRALLYSVLSSASPACLNIGYIAIPYNCMNGARMLLGFPPREQKVGR